MRSNSQPLRVQHAGQPERIPVPGRSTPTRVTPIRSFPAVGQEPLLTAGQEPAPNAPRVLVVAPQPFYEDRGTPIATRQLMQAFSHLGYAVDLVTYPIGRSIDIPGVTYHRTANPLGIERVPIGFSMRKVALDVALTGTLHARLRARRYAFIHAVEEAAFPAVVLGRRYGIPVVYDMQSSLPEQLMKHAPLRGPLAQRILRACERWLLRRADLVIASAGLGEHVNRVAPSATVLEWRFSSPVAPLPEERLAATRASLGIPPRAPVVMYSGNFEEYQGVPMLVGAIPRVLAAVPDAVFVLLGAQGPDQKAVRERAAALRLNGSLRIIERQPREHIPEYLAIADVLVSPRLYGGNLPLKIFDYLAAGRPIIATDIPTHRKVLDDSLAVLVRPHESDMAGALVSVLTDRDRSSRLAEGARGFALQHLGWMAFVQAVSDLSHTVTRRV